MFRKGYDFVKRHKKKAALVGAVYGGVYAYNNSEVVRLVVDHTWNWTWHKLSEMTAVLNTSPNLPHDNLSSTSNNLVGNIANDESVIATTIQLLSEALKIINEQLDTESLRLKISQNPSNRLELWDDMKILAWSRFFVSVYTVCHLVVYVKVQTGVASRFMSHQSRDSPERLQWKLSLISRHMQLSDFYPVREGLVNLIKTVKNVVRKPVAPRGLQDALSPSDVKQIFYEVRKLMEAGSNHNGFVHPRNYHLEFVVPADQLDRAVIREPITDSSDQRILLSLNEDANRALESVDCNMVLNCCLEKCFTHVFSDIDTLIKERSSHVSRQQTLSSIPHVALLPALDRMSRIFSSPLDAVPVITDLVGINYFDPFVDSIIHQSLQRDSLATDDS